MEVIFSKDNLGRLLALKVIEAYLQDPIKSPKTTQLIELAQQPKPLPPCKPPQIRAKEESESTSTTAQGITKGGHPKSRSDFVINIEKKHDQVRPQNIKEKLGTWATHCVYRVPQYLREVDNKSFIPQTVSLGPYHRTKLPKMETHKKRSLENVLLRKKQEKEDYLKSIKKLEFKARACYNEEIDLNSDDFAEMMVLDGCFLLELFQGNDEGFTELGYTRDDPIFSERSTTMHSIQRDSMMLENQIPLLILDRLYGLQTGKPDVEVKRRVAELAIKFFNPPLPSFDPLSDVEYDLHCLHAFRRSLLWPRKSSVCEDSKSLVDKRMQHLIHCVTQLRDKGIRFKKREFKGGRSCQFWDIKFKKGVLYIPQLLVYYGTKSRFLNLIAFEQCHLDSSNQITSYAVFMDNLINSAEDVTYLQHRGIIEHWLGSNAEVAELFNSLCKEVVFDRTNSYLSKLSKEVKAYCNNSWNGWLAILNHKYFDNPWSIISVVAAFVLLLLTAIQTFYAVYGYYKPTL